MLRSLVGSEMCIRDRLWKEPFTEHISSLITDPFCHDRLCLTGHNAPWIRVVREVDASGSKLYSSKYNVLQAGQDNSSVVSAVFSPHARHILYMVMTRQLIIFDMRICRVLRTTGVQESWEPPYRQLLLCWEAPELVLGLHTDASISVWRHHTAAASRGNPELSSPTVWEELKPVAKRGGGVLACCGGPLNPLEICIVTNSGTLAVVGPAAAPQSMDSWRDISLEGNTVCGGAVSALLRPIVAGCCVDVRHEAGLAAVGSDAGSIAIVDLRRREVVKHWQHCSGGPVLSARWVMDEAIAVVSQPSGDDPVVHLCNVKSGAVMQVDTRCKKRAPGIGMPPREVLDLRISPSGQYVAVILRSFPMEIWKFSDQDTQGPPQRLLPPDGSQSFPDNLTAMSWVRPGFGSAPAGDQFIVANAAGILLRYVAGSGTFVAARQRLCQNLGTVTCLATQGSMIVAGDSLGSVHFWDMKNKQHKAFVTQRGAITPIQFAPTNESNHVAVLFHGGEFGVWDLDQQQRISMNERPEHHAADLCWASADTILAACHDGTLRIFNRSLTECRSSVLAQSADQERQMSVPGLVTNSSFEAIADQLKKLKVGSGPEVQGSEAEAQGLGVSKGRGRVSQIWRNAAPEEWQEVTASDSVERECYLVSKLVGDSEQVRFWALVESMVKAHDAQQPHEVPFGHLDLFGTAQNMRDSLHAKTQQLRESGDVQTDPELKKSVVNDLILQDKLPDAIDLLLDCDLKTAEGRAAGFKACVLAHSVSPEVYISTVKFVAMQLFASGHMEDAIQLLTCNGLVADSCAQLQDLGRWVESVQLGKLRLDPQESRHIYERWATRLESGNQPLEAVMVHLSLGSFKTVVHMLHQLGYYETAKVFALVCQDHGIELGDWVADSKKHRRETNPNPDPHHQQAGTTNQEAEQEGGGIESGGEAEAGQAEEEPVLGTPEHVAAPAESDSESTDCHT
eukprot:TRINITY_DN43178_c0_g1_i4.p1 TRINITY_DN43178_c0_g1~~TRINITY_DN43178_c0_g1_i4.p1  ORF type:complete len:963 (+),score=223.72 TRINITY_DN43178_c0_g1_i4:143-3031(+)